MKWLLVFIVPFLNASENISGFIFDRYPPVHCSNVEHRLAAAFQTDNGEYTLEFEDGSAWKINSYDGEKALHWRSHDPLTLTQNLRWFKSYDYRIVNQNNGSSVEANILSPIEQGPHIISIDFDHRQIALSDNTRWEISPLDTFKDWIPSDIIVIGSNSDWDADSPILLINTNKNTFARAKQL